MVKSIQYKFKGEEIGNLIVDFKHLVEKEDVVIFRIKIEFDKMILNVIKLKKNGYQILIRDNVDIDYFLNLIAGNNRYEITTCQ